MLIKDCKESKFCLPFSVIVGPFQANGRNDTNQNDTKHNDTQQNNSQHNNITRGKIADINLTLFRA